MEKEKLLISLMEEYSRCTRCGLYKKAKNKVFGEGKITSPLLMFIGMAPGEKENETGLPFRGKAGGVFDSLLSSAQIKRKECYVTNLVLCRSFEMVEKKAVNRDPTLKDEVKSCLERLLQEIYIVDPVMLVLLGKLPAQALVGVSREMKELRGKIYTVSFKGKEGNITYPAIVTWHPAYLLYKPSTLLGDPKHQAYCDLSLALETAKKLQQLTSGIGEEEWKPKQKMEAEICPTSVN